MVKPLRPNPCPTSTLFPTAHRMDHVPFMLKWPLNCSPASLKVKKIMFCHWFSHMKFISSPFSGSEAAVSKSANSLCFVSVSAGEILKSLCTKLFKFYIILELCFFGVEAHWSPLCLWELSTVCGLAVCCDLGSALFPKCSLQPRTPTEIYRIWLRREGGGRK